MKSLSLEFELKRLLRAVIVLLSHLVLAVIMIAGLWLLELLFQRIFQSNEPRLFGEVPLNYIFHAMDVAVLSMFIFNGILEVFQTYSRRPFRRGQFRDRS